MDDPGIWVATRVYGLKINAVFCHEITAPVGTDLPVFIATLCDKAPASGTFNGVQVHAVPGETTDLVRRRYDAKAAKLAQKRRSSNHGRGGSARDRRRGWREDARW